MPFTVTVGALVVFNKAVPPCAIVTLVTVTVQLVAPAARSTPLMVNTLPATERTSAAPPVVTQVPPNVGAAGVNVIPVGRVSLTAISVSAGLPATFEIVIVMTLAAPCAIGFVPNDFATVGGNIVFTTKHCGVTVDAVALLLTLVKFALLLVKALGLAAHEALVCCVGVCTLVTSSVNVHVVAAAPPAFTPRAARAAFTTMVLLPAVAVISATVREQPALIAEMPFGVAMIKPDGSVSVKLTPVAAGLLIGFVSVNVKADLPPAEIVVGANAFVIFTSCVTIKH